MRAPVYSHVVYDIVDGEENVVRQPDILILEGLNVLQVGDQASEFVSDYFDFSIYIDAEESHIEEWYVERFLTLRETVFQDPRSYFRHFAHLSHDEAVATARGIWRRSTARTCARTSCRRGRGPRWCCARAPTTRVTQVQLRKL